MHEEIEIMAPERTAVRFVLFGGQEITIAYRDGGLRVTSTGRLAVEPVAGNNIRIVMAPGRGEEGLR